MLKGKTTSLKLNLKQEKFVNGFIPPFDKKTIFVLVRHNKKTNLPFIAMVKTSIKGIICYAFTSTTATHYLENEKKERDESKTREGIVSPFT